MSSYTSPFTGDVIIPTDVSYKSYTITSDLVLEWPANVNPVTNVAARIIEISAGVGLKVYMPPANQASVGQDALIRNTGGNTFTVVDSDGNTITTVVYGKAEYIYITDNATTAGTWGIIDFGAGTSSGSASTLAGYGLLAISATLNQSHPTSTFTNGYTFTSSDRAQSKMWTSGSGVVYLPLASSLGNNWFTLLKNNGSGTLTVVCTATDSLDQQPTKTFNPNESALLVCTGTEYITVGYGTSNTFFFTALTKSVSSGTVTLTTSEAQSIIQEYVGSLTGDVTVIYPPVVALYVVSNQTTANGHTLTLSTGISGGATAIVPSGQQSSLICDGVNFYNANTVQSGASSTSLVNGSAGSPSLYFALEATTGIYRPGSGQFGISILGIQRLDVTSSGITVTGTGTFTGGILGGTF
jgi:hypothetical protein